MLSLYSLAKALPLFSVAALAAARYPDKPADKTTPVQQRISVNGPNSEWSGHLFSLLKQTSTNDSSRHVYRLEYL